MMHVTTKQDVATVQRGKLVVFEGCDMTGKSYHVTELVGWLATHCPVKSTRYPDRSRLPLGPVINGYLRGEVLAGNRASSAIFAHKLFSAERTLRNNEVAADLAAGWTVVADRYVASGAAYTAATVAVAAQREDVVAWCLAVDRDVLKPDVVVQLTASPHVLEDRLGHRGPGEVYENMPFLARVCECYGIVHQQYADACTKWFEVCTDGDRCGVQQQIRSLIELHVMANRS